MRIAFTHAGYSLIETMVVLVIMTTVLSVGLPSLSQMLSTVRLRSSMTAMTSALRLARYEAIRRNGRVVLCKSQTGRSCSREGGWEQGWIVFYDDNNNRDLDGDEVVLYGEPILPLNVRLTGNGPVSEYVSYSSYGRAKLVSGAFQAGTLTICERSSTPTEAYQVIINVSGRPRVEKSMVDRC